MLYSRVGFEWGLKGWGQDSQDLKRLRNKDPIHSTPKSQIQVSTCRLSTRDRMCRESFCKKSRASKDREFRAISVLANSVLGSILWILLFSFPKIGLFGLKVSDWLLTDLLTG